MFDVSACKLDPMRAAIYIRQSQYHDGSISEELQETTSRALAAREGWEVVAVFKDIDISGTSTKGRKGLRALRDLYDDGGFDIAVAHAASRFARNMADGADIVAAMPLATVLEGVAPADDDFVPLLHMLLAHKQSKEIGKRWREVHAHKLANGLPATGRPRFGYRYQGGVYTPDPVTGPVVTQVYRRYIEGAGWHTLVRDLNDAGHPTTTGAAWTTPTLRKYCDTGFAAGRLVVHGEIAEQRGAHEPLITEREWALYQAARKSRARYAPRAQTAPWWLSRVAVCGLCGTGLVSSGRKKYPSVSCPARTKSGNCVGVHISKPGLEQLVAWWLGGHVNEWAAALPDYTAERVAAEAVLEARERALEALEAKRARLARLLVDEVLDEAGYAGARIELDAEIATAREAVDAARETLLGFLPADADVYERLTAAPDMSTGEWNGLVRKIVRAVRVYKDRVEVEPLIGEPVTLDRPPRAKRLSTS